MANTSIYAAFERMWQYIVASLNNKSNINHSHDEFDKLSSDKADTVKNLSGEIITLNDSAHVPMKGLRIFGKTTQNGTPTPEAPVPLESVGDGGEINTTVCGRNLISEDAVAVYAVAQHDEAMQFGSGQKKYDLGIQFKKNTQYTLSYIGKRSDNGNVRFCMFYTDGTNSGAYGSITNDGEYHEIIVVSQTGKTVEAIGQTFGSGGYFYLKRNSLILNEGSTKLPYEPYKGQSLTISTPNGLPGIPVTSGGNYTDENGQQWVCDEVDFTRGVYVQRVRVLDFSTMTWEYNSAIEAWVSGENVADMKSDALICETLPKYLIMGNDRELGAKANPPYSIWARNGSDTNTPTGKAIGLLVESIETPLSAEELAQYAALHTNYPNTTIFNDGGAGMEVKYYTPTTAVQMVHSPSDEGKVLSIDEHGCVVLSDDVGGSVVIDLDGDGSNIGDAPPINANTLNGSYENELHVDNSDRLGGVPANEYAKLVDLENINSSGMSMELLWENASPTSEFADMRININDLSNCSHVLIEFMYANTLQWVIGRLCKIGQTNVVSASMTKNYYREIGVDTSSIYFKKAYVYNTYAGSSTEVTTHLIPYKIYSIKGVSA